MNGSIDWSYFKGPAKALGWNLRNINGNIEAWIEEGKEIENLIELKDNSNIITLIAYFDGQKYISIPNKLPTPNRRSVTGWTKITGRYDGTKVTWDSVVSFP